MKHFYFTLLTFLTLTCFINAQTDLEYTFDGTSWDGWSSQGGDGSFVSTFGNNPNGELEITWTPGTNTRNIVMYPPSEDQAINASLKFVQIKLSNTSSEIGTLRIRGNNGSWFNAVDQTITTDASGSFSTYNFEITDSNWTGSLANWQIVFRRSDNGVITDNGTLEIDNILFSSSTTLTIEKQNAFKFAIYPNPTRDKLFINSKETINKIETFDLLGNTVLIINNVKQYIDVSSLSNGIYIVKLTSDNGISTKRFVKQ